MFRTLSRNVGMLLVVDVMSGCYTAAPVVALLKQGLCLLSCCPFPAVLQLLTTPTHRCGQPTHRAEAQRPGASSCRMMATRSLLTQTTRPPGRHTPRACEPVVRRCKKSACTAAVQLQELGNEAAMQLQKHARQAVRSCRRQQIQAAAQLQGLLPQCAAAKHERQQRGCPAGHTRTGRQRCGHSVCASYKLCYVVVVSFFPARDKHCVFLGVRYLPAVNALSGFVCMLCCMHVFIYLFCTWCMHMHMYTVQHESCYLVWSNASLFACMRWGGARSCLPHCAAAASAGASWLYASILCVHWRDA